MKIKIIATGSSKLERIIGRWGVSFLIGEDVLFDTFGDPGVFLNNMRKFNVDAGKIKHIILSHDDWDHISGLWYLIRNRADITVYICPGFRKEIKDRIASFGVKLIEAKDATLIKEHIYSTGQLYGESEGRKIYEQSLVLKTDKGLTIICGCAHPGILKIIDDIRKRLEGKIHLVIGGFHLKDNTQAQISAIIKEIRHYGLEKIAPMHCTGGLATELIKDKFKDAFIQVNEGSTIEV